MIKNHKIYEQNLKKADNLLSIIQKIVTIAAVIIGGLWTYNLFIMHREAYPKGDVSYQIEEIKLSDEYILIQVFIRIKNTGNTVLRLRKGDVRLLDISFPNKRIEKKVDALQKNKFRKKPTFNWATIQYVIKEWKEGEIEIEPNTVDQIDFEFIIKSNFKFIKIYSWFTNLEKPIDDGWIGWTASEIYKIE